MNRIQNLDFLRGIAIVYTIFGHWIGYSDYPHEIFRQFSRLIPNGHLGVRLFFVISGYIITLIFIREVEKRNNIQISNFFKKRVLRIFPIYFLYLVFIFSLNPILQLDLKPTDLIHPSFFLMCFNMSGHWLISHFWSLNVEEWFYVLYPFVIMLYVKLNPFKSLKRMANGLFLICTALYVLTLIFPTSENFIFRNMIYLSAGVLLAAHKSRAEVVFERVFSSIGGIVFVCLQIGYAYSFPIINDYTHGSAFCDILTLITCIMTFSLMMFTQNKFLCKLVHSKGGKALSYLGLACYSLYIWQQFFLASTEFWFNQFPFNLLFVFIVGLASFEIVEKYFEKIKKRVLIQREIAN